MKSSLLTLLIATAFLTDPHPASAAPDAAYEENDLVMFFRNPNGTTGQDGVVAFSLGSSWNLFRRAATPGDPSFGQVINLGNIATALSNAYGTDWMSLSSSVFVGAVAGGPGPNDLDSSYVTDGDFSRTVYITSPRNDAGTYGVRNSANRNVPSSASGSSIVAGNVGGANSVLLNATANPASSTDAVQPLWRNFNPIGTNNIVGQAYGGIFSGVMGAVSSNTYSYGSISNVVRGLDLYRITPRTNNDDFGGIAWQNQYSIARTYGGTGTGASAIGSAYFLGTITLGRNGDVNFVPVGAGAAVDDYTAWAAGYPTATLTNKSADFDGDGFRNVDEYAFGTDPTKGNAALSTATAVSNNLAVGFFRRSTTNSQAPTYGVFSTTDLASAFTNNPATVSILTNSAPSGYQAASFTLPAAGRGFYRIRATLP